MTPFPRKSRRSHFAHIGSPSIYTIIPLLTSLLFGWYYQLKMSTEDTSTLSQLIGSWELLDHCAFPPNQEKNRAYPLGNDPKGIIVFAPDGYSSATMITSGREESSPSPDQAQSNTNPAFAGGHYMAYTSRYSLEATENGTLLNLQVLLANVPDMAGNTQQRLVQITDGSQGRILSLSLVQPMKYAGEDMIVKVRWQRLADLSPTKS